MSHREAIQGARYLQTGLTLALLLVAGCAAPLPVAPSVFPDAGASVFNFTLQAAHAVAVGQTLPLQVSALDDQGNAVAADPAQLKISWVSSNPTTASVTPMGVVTALKAGTVTITATSQNPARVVTFSLQVLSAGQTAPPPSPMQSPTPGYPFVIQPTDAPASQAPLGLGFRVYPLQPRVEVGSRLKLTAYQGTNGRMAPTSATWQSSDPTIASVDTTGVITGRKAGLVTVLADSLTYPGLQEPISVEVVAPVQAYQLKGISLTPSHASLSVGQSLFVQANIPTWDGNHDANIRWTVSDANLLSVSSAGQVTALAPGSATVTAIAVSYTQGTLSATIPITILNSSSSQPLANF